MTELYWFMCCDHCECPDFDRWGHDDTCRYGCNDEELMRMEEMDQ